MKANIKKLLTVLGVSITLFTGCETYDDSELTGRVDDLENRVQALEERIEEFQNSVDEFTELINQFKNDVRITDFAETSDGYLINFSDGSQMHIKHGELPELSVVFNSELQEYVWTANGEVIVDDDGNPIPAYIAPQFEVRDGKLGYTLGNEWHEVTNGETVGLIADVVETDDGVNFILSSGSVITIPKVGFRLNIDYFEYGAEPGKTVVINYNLVDGDDNAEVLVYPDEGFTVVNRGYSLEVTLPADEETAYSGKVLVMAVNGNGATSAKVIRFGALVTEITSADVINVSRHGGLVSINISSNRPYNAMIQSDPVTFIPPNWLLPSEGPATKAPREDVIYYEVQPMPDEMDEDRQATILVQWDTNIKEEQQDYVNYENYIIKREIIINQLNSKDVAVDKPMDNDGNLYPADKMENTLLEGKLEGGWTFKNCVVVEYDDDNSEVRLALNGLNAVEDGRGSLTSPILENGVGIFTIKYSSIMPNANSRQHIIFEVKCVDDAGNLIDNKKYEITQNRTLQAESVIKEETFEFNVNQPCRIVVSNISTKKESSTEIKTFNVMKIHSAYYTSYKAE